jgi:hypothetical protein
MQTKISKCYPLNKGKQGGHPEKAVAIELVFKAIKTNAPIRKQVEKIRAAQTAGDTKAKQAAKKALPCITPAAIFKTKRQKSDIESFTGLSVLDFDHVKDVTKFKKQITKLPIVFACFVSPSGDGLKVLIKTPAVKDQDSHVGTFLSLKEYFNSEYLDDSGKDFTRLCFLSHDPDIYVNEESTDWTQQITQKSGSSSVKQPRPDVDVEKREEVILTELKKIAPWLFEPITTNRNNTVMKAAAMFCDYGISQDVAIDIMRKNVADWKDFKETEFKKATAQGYKQGDAGSKTVTKRPDIPTSFSRGTKRPAAEPTGIEEITESFEKLESLEVELVGVKAIAEAFEADPKVSKSSSFSRGKKVEEKPVEAEVLITVDELNDPIFWYYKETGTGAAKKKTLTLDVVDLLDWLAFFGFGSTKVADEPLLVRMVENVVEIVMCWDIKHFTINWLNDRYELDKFGDAAEVKRLFLSKPALTELKNLSGLPPIQIKKLRDKKTSSMLYYENAVATVSKNKLTLSAYTDLSAPIWKDELNGRMITEAAPEGAGHFEQFIANVSNLSDETAEHNKLAFETAIGYMIHGYKSSSTNKIVTTNDSHISSEGVSSGRSGKGLFGKSFGHVRSRYEISGKTIKPDDKFWLQGVKSHHQIVNFEDMARKFNFESLYNLATDDWTVEDKYKSSIQIPAAESPKIIVSTNFTISALDPSTVDRIHNLEFSTHYHAGVRGQKDHRPKDDFGIELFRDWTGKNAIQWQYYDHYIVRCLQMYLTHGLIKAKTKNLKRRQLINAVGMSLVEWLEDAITDGTIVFDEKVANIDVHEQYVRWCNRNHIERFDRDQRSFTSKMYRYFRDSGFDLQTGDNIKIAHNNGGRVRGFIVSRTEAIDVEITGDELPKEASDSIQKNF